MPGRASCTAAESPVSTALIALLVGAAVYFAVTELGVEAWYRLHEMRAPTTAGWRFVWPRDLAPAGASAEDRSFVEGRVAGSVKDILCFESARFGSWTDQRGYRWVVHEIEWKADKALNGIDVLHNPTACMPAAGYRLVKDYGQKVFPVAGRELAFHRYEFSSGGSPIYVFTTSFESLELPRPLYRDGVSGRSGMRFFQAVTGNRLNPVRLLHVAVAGPRNESAAESLLSAQLNARLRFE